MPLLLTTNNSIEKEKNIWTKRLSTVQLHLDPDIRPPGIESNPIFRHFFGRITKPVRFRYPAVFGRISDLTAYASLDVKLRFHYPAKNGRITESKTGLDLFELSGCFWPDNRNQARYKFRLVWDAGSVIRPFLADNETWLLSDPLSDYFIRITEPKLQV